MDDAVIGAQARWPHVPAVRGWLRLDARGNWLLRAPESGRFERIGHAGLREHLCRNYACDTAGRWFLQNGPQRVFVEFERAPLVLRLEQGALVDHCGRPAGIPTEAWLDEADALYLRVERGLGSLDDRDLMALAEPLEAGWFVLGEARLRLGRTARAALLARCGIDAG